MSYRARCDARKLRTMRGATRIRLGLLKPATPEELQAILKHLYPALDMFRLAFGGTLPWWLQLSVDRRWTTKDWASAYMEAHEDEWIPHPLLSLVERAIDRDLTASAAGSTDRDSGKGAAGG